MKSMKTFLALIVSFFGLTLLIAFNTLFKRGKENERSLIQNISPRNKYWESNKINEALDIILSKDEELSILYSAGIIKDIPGIFMTNVPEKWAIPHSKAEFLLQELLIRCHKDLRDKYNKRFMIRMEHSGRLQEFNNNLAVDKVDESSSGKLTKKKTVRIRIETDEVETVKPELTETDEIEAVEPDAPGF